LAIARAGVETGAVSGILAAAGRAVAALGFAAVVSPLVGLVAGTAAASPSAVPRDPADSVPAIAQPSLLVRDIPARETEAAPTTVPRRGPASSDGIATGGVPSTGRWGWPLAPAPAVVQRFLPPPHPWSAGHRGVDLAAVIGQQVRSPDAGVVTFGGLVAGRGVVVVTHAGGLRSTFEPVEQALPAGTPVTRDQPVGTVTASPGHCAPATCLHWGVLRGDVYLDPVGLVGLQRVVLLPLG
jgi:murein DD-endopeptidase MepM/ murein hydrolase activator NlpD